MTLWALKHVTLTARTHRSNYKIFIETPSIIFFGTPSALASTLPRSSECNSQLLM